MLDFLKFSFKILFPNNVSQSHVGTKFWKKNWDVEHFPKIKMDKIINLEEYEDVNLSSLLFKKKKIKKKNFNFIIKKKSALLYQEIVIHFSK
jgi:hypothetical protein